MADQDPDTPSLAEVASNDEGNDSSLPQESGDEEDDDYDPSSFGFNGDAGQRQSVDEGTPTSASIAHRAQLQPDSPPRVRTVGGFIVEDEDEDEEDGEKEGDSVVATPAHAGVTVGQDISLGSVPTSDTAAPLASSTTSLNGSHTTNAVPISDAAVSAAATSAAAPDTKIALEVNGTLAKSLPPTVLDSSAARLPHDRVGRLEDRIKDDPRADTEAWRALLQYYKEKDQLENIRKTYERFLEVFPTSASIWIEYIRFVLESMDRNAIDGLLSRSLERVQSLDLWNTYLDYLRRILPLSNDPSGSNRSTITQAFEAVLDNVGVDPDAGNLWSEYIDFISAGPGTIGGSGWQDAQKMDLLRKAYQRAVKMPHSELTRLWKEYDKFEMNLNKTNGRKALQEQSPHYMTARSANMQLSQWTHNLDRQSLPVLPPIVGCEGDDAFGDQVEKWRGWIAWEKTDPLVFKDEDVAAYRKRVCYAYNQAVMQLRFYPQIWYDAAQWCFDQGTEDMKIQGDKFLDQGIIANPESVLLALKKADRIELSLDAGSTDAVAVSNGERLDVPFETVLKALYSLREKMVQREKRAISHVQEHFASLPPEDDVPETAAAFDDDNSDDDDDQTSGNNAIRVPQSRKDQMQIQIQAITTASRGQLDVLKRTISYVWVAKMRAFRRIQGQGMPNKPKKGFRGVFAEARPRGQLSSDVYIASALMEWHCYKDPSALKIFERGLKLFPTDELFAQEYIKHLISINDLTNARVVFETTITKILAPAPANTTTIGAFGIDAETQKRQRVRPLFGYMHSFESNYGDLAQIQKLERRMADLYPNEPDLARFADRFTSMPPANFDAIDIQLIISPTQARPKFPLPVEAPILGPGVAVTSIENPTNDSNVRLGPQAPYVASPKRPLEDSDTDSPQRKYLRAESPLKGAAGRRMQMNAAAALAASNLNGPGFAVKNYVPGSNPPIGEPVSGDAGAPLLPKSIYELLRKLPSAKDYNAIIFDPVRTVEFLRSYDLQAARARVGR